MLSASFWRVGISTKTLSPVSNAFRWALREGGSAGSASAFWMHEADGLTPR